MARAKGVGIFDGSFTPWRKEKKNTGMKNWCPWAAKKEKTVCTGNNNFIFHSMTGGNVINVFRLL